MRKTAFTGVAINEDFNMQAFHEAMQPSLRGARLYDERFRSEGVAMAARARALALP